MIAKTASIAPGLEELRQARRKSRGLYWAVALFSAFANVLMLTGPLYMLQVYDRVLSSRSVETLVALTALIAFLYVIMGVLDFARGRVLARIGARFQDDLDPRVFNAAIGKSSQGNGEMAQTALADLEAIQRFIASPGPTAGLDSFWTPVFLIGIAMFHPWLGYLALLGGGFLILLAALNQATSATPLTRAKGSLHRAAHLGEQLRAEAEMVRSLGMQRNAFLRWGKLRGCSLRNQLSATDLAGVYSAITKTFRLFLQSAMLGLGAFLVLKGELSPGAMIAASILLGRALAPIELAIGHWPAFQRARNAWWSLAALLSEVPQKPPRVELPRPAARLEAQSLTVVPPGHTQASLRLINFKVEPGQAMGVIGPSGAGKSTLARVLTGTWPATGGKVRLDRASLDQYAPDALGEYIGYLPQRGQLFDGTVAENIARLAPEFEHTDVAAAAKQADAHEMILSLPDGYDTAVSRSGGMLSGGQVQRIGLARALYSNPVILVLDEPNAHQDNLGAEALNRVIQRMKAHGKSVIIMAHRPAALRECDTLLVLKGGSVESFGPRDEILRHTVVNHSDLPFPLIAAGMR